MHDIPNRIWCVKFSEGDKLQQEHYFEFPNNILDENLILQKFCSGYRRFPIDKQMSVEELFKEYKIELISITPAEYEEGKVYSSEIG